MREREKGERERGGREERGERGREGEREGGREGLAYIIPTFMILQVCSSLNCTEVNTHVHSTCHDRIPSLDPVYLRMCIINLFAL